MTFTGTDIVEIIKVIAPLLSLVFMPVIAMWIRRLEKNVNSKMDKLIDTTARESEAIGRKKEKDIQELKAPSG